VVITEVIIRVFLYLVLYIIRATILHTQMSPPTSCTMFSYTQLLHVSAMYPSLLQGRVQRQWQIVIYNWNNIYIYVN